MCWVNKWRERWLKSLLCLLHNLLKSHMCCGKKFGLGVLLLLRRHWRIVIWMESEGTVFLEGSFLPWVPRWHGGKECLPMQRHRRLRFSSWVRKIPQRGKWQPTPVFLPGKIPWTEEPGGLQSMGLQGVGHDWVTEHTHMHFGHGAETETREGR